MINSALPILIRIIPKPCGFPWMIRGKKDLECLFLHDLGIWLSMVLIEARDRTLDRISEASDTAEIDVDVQLAESLKSLSSSEEQLARKVSQLNTRCESARAHLGDQIAGPNSGGWLLKQEVKTQFERAYTELNSDVPRRRAALTRAAEVSLPVAIKEAREALKVAGTKYRQAIEKWAATDRARILFFEDIVLSDPNDEPGKKMISEAKSRKAKERRAYLKMLRLRDSADSAKAYLDALTPVPAVSRAADKARRAVALGAITSHTFYTFDFKDILGVSPVFDKVQEKDPNWAFPFVTKLHEVIQNSSMFEYAALAMRVLGENIMRDEIARSTSGDIRNGSASAIALRPSATPNYGVGFCEWAEVQGYLWGVIPSRMLKKTYDARMTQCINQDRSVDRFYAERGYKGLEGFFDWRMGGKDRIARLIERVNQIIGLS